MSNPNYGNQDGVHGNIKKNFDSNKYIIQKIIIPMLKAKRSDLFYEYASHFTADLKQKHDLLVRIFSNSMPQKQCKIELETTSSGKEIDMLSSMICAPSPDILGLPSKWPVLSIPSRKVIKFKGEDKKLENKFVELITGLRENGKFNEILPIKDFATPLLDENRWDIYMKFFPGAMGFWATTWDNSWVFNEWNCVQIEQCFLFTDNLSNVFFRKSCKTEQESFLNNYPRRLAWNDNEWFCNKVFEFLS